MDSQPRGLRCVACALLSLAVGCGDINSTAQDASHSSAAGFAPQLLGVGLNQDSVRPGDSFLIHPRFANGGTRVDSAHSSVFVHFETSGGDCETIAFQADHDPETPTARWLPGDQVVDVVGNHEFGTPQVVYVPATCKPGLYHIHLGLFHRDNPGQRHLDEVLGSISVSWDAPPTSEWDPEPMEEEEGWRRKRALAERYPNAVKLEGPSWIFALDQQSGGFLFTDRNSGAHWSSNPFADRWGLVRLAQGAEVVDLEVDGFDSIGHVAQGLVGKRVLTIPGAEHPLHFTLTISPTEDGNGIRIESSLDNPTDWQVQHWTGLDRAFTVSDAEQGYALAPRWLGELLPTDRGLPVGRLWGANELAMEMTGVVKDGQALLISWDAPEVSLVTHLSLSDSPFIPGRRSQSISLWTTGPGQAVEVRPAARGDYVGVAQAYRELARARGYHHSWAEKRAAAPQLELLEGAPQFRFTALHNRLPGTPDNAGAEPLEHLAHSFRDIARCAEHWRRTLGIERAQIVVAGWNRAGYDNQHPDILPANDEAGGNAELKQLAETVAAMGYALFLHDNYQDIYQASPSWDAGLVNLDENGAPRLGGLWDGGQAQRLCTLRQVDFARRNLPEVARAFGAPGYFLDTTLTTRLETCSSTDHPMGVREDRAARLELFNTARAHFPLLGLEGVREWAVPSAVFFEGALSQKTVHNPNWIVIPLFPLVYGDCLDLLPIQSDLIGLDDAAKILDHISYAQLPSFSFGEGAYFERESRAHMAARPHVSHFDSHGNGEFTLELAWEVTAQIEQDAEIFVHFTHPRSPRAEGLVFQDDFLPPMPSSTWRPGATVLTGTRRLRLVPGLWREGPWEVRVGCLAPVPGGGEQRLTLDSPADAGQRILLGTLHRDGGQLRLELPPAAGDRRVFTRADGGWAAELKPTDRLIKNVVEVLTPLKRLVVGKPMTEHRFLTADRTVERTHFGPLAITVNRGENPFEVGGTSLPQFGFLVTSPTFVAFHATSFGGLDYPGGALFTLRSLDEKPLAESATLRVYHGFGGDQVRLADRVVTVEREAVINQNAATPR